MASRPNLIDNASGGLVESLAVTDPFLGRVIAGKYRIIRRLGAGGMGAVYHARHEQTGGDCAVKFLHGTAVGDESSVRRFQLEAQNAAALRHSNTIRVTDFGVDEGLLYLVMEFLEGHALSDLLTKFGALPWRRAVHIARQVLKSLWEAHEHARHIIHRDIKPANIFIVDLPGEPDHVRVLDFGISRALAGSGAGTQGLLGTPFYMAPELWRGEQVDARTDLYALGCVMFQMLAGIPPFVPPPSAGDSLFPLLDMHLHSAPPVLGNLVPGVPSSIAEYVDALLAKSPDDRPPSARAALEALDQAAQRAVDVPDNEPTIERPRPLPATPTITADRKKPTAAKPAPAKPAPASSTTKRSTVLPWVVLGVLLFGGSIALAVATMGKKSEPTAPTRTAETTTSAPTTVPTTIEPTRAPIDDDDDDPVAPSLNHPTFGMRQASYRARLSQYDHVGVDGSALLRAGEILARDRQRYHQGYGDSEDQSEGGTGGDPSAYEAYAQLMNQFVDPTTAHDIISGTPLIEVVAYERGLVVQVISH